MSMKKNQGRVAWQKTNRRYKATLVAVVLGVVSAWSLGWVSPVQAGVVPGAVHEYDASQDTDGDQTWEDLGTQADRDWTLFGPTGPTRTAVSSATTITYAYNFDGVDDTAVTAPENRSGNHDTTFEIWFRPDLFPTGDVRTIFEQGNGRRGVSFGLSEETLVFAYGAAFLENSSVLNSGELTFSLNSIGITDFIQVVGVIDDTNDQIRLYVNGGNEQTLAISDFSSDFTSNRPSGLGSNQSGGGGQDGSAFTWSGFYDGDIALLREYRTPFGLAEVQQNFAAITNPGDFDADGDVDGADFLLWQRGGSPPTNPLNGSDLALWETNFGGTPSVTLAIPEPSTAILASLLFATIYFRPLRRPI